MISSKELIRKRILIVGSNGMLGQRLTESYKPNNKVELHCCSLEDTSYIKNVDYTRVDITKKKQIKKLILSFYPDFVINASGFTAVDRCESEKELAWKINVTGVEYLVQFCRAVETNLIHISSDYIFDGKDGPYTENNKPNPVSSYGRSKLAAENSLRTAGIPYTILRTNVLYGPTKFGRPDFVKWVVNSLREKKEIRIVTDQVNNPTFIDNLVYAVKRCIEYKKKGIYNIGGAEFLSRYKFTLRIAEYFNLVKDLIIPILTKDLQQPAPRPLKSGLITLKAETELNYKPHSIEETFLLMKKELNL